MSDKPQSETPLFDLSMLALRNPQFVAEMLKRNPLAAKLAGEAQTMSDKPKDWADEIALDIWKKTILGFNDALFENGAQPILATALRKAKADGVRECAAAFDAAGRDGWDAVKTNAGPHLRGLADKIERGES